MTRGTKKRGGKPERPTSRAEGARRVGLYLRYLYGWDAKPADLAPVVVDVALIEIATVEDRQARRLLLQRLMDRAYAALVET